MANTGNCKQGFVIMSEMEKRATQTGTTTIRHLYFSEMCMGKKQGVIQSFGDL